MAMLFRLSSVDMPGRILDLTTSADSRIKSWENGLLGSSDKARHNANLRFWLQLAGEFFTIYLSQKDIANQESPDALLYWSFSNHDPRVAFGWKGGHVSTGRT